VLFRSRSLIEANFTNEVRTLKTSAPEDSGRKKETVLQLKEVWFRYHRDTPDILKGASLTVYRNEILCILGGNASGKSTMLGVIAGILKAYGGTITLFDKKLQSYKYGSLYRNNLALLPQDVTTVFTGNTVEEDGKELGNLQESLPFDISGLLHRHPYDLSGGEQQLCALAKVLLQKPRLLLLDEPTKGIDAYAKRDIIKILKDLKKSGMTIILVTHDVEFAAACADRCALLFDGDIISADTPELFFAENNFYTTAANRMTRYIYDNIVTIEEAIEICRRNGRKADSALEAEGNEA
jgi:energy-coupling factor transporter ATP-binding protein EcfA2